MTSQEIITLMGQIKLLLPTIQIPDFENKSEEEKKSLLAIYIMVFGKLDYKKTLLVLKNLITNESKFESFKKYPIPTIVQEYNKKNTRDLYNQKFIEQIVNRGRQIDEKKT